MEEDVKKLTAENEALQSMVETLRSMVAELQAELEKFRGDNERHLMAVQHATEMLAIQRKDVDRVIEENEKLKASAKVK